MTNKGTIQSLATRAKISLSNQKDRTIINLKIGEYLLGLKKGDFPTLTDCAIYAGISEKTLILYEMQTPEGSEVREALDLIRDLQKSRLIHGGLEKRFDSKIVTLLLKSVHGFKEEPAQLTQNNTFNVSPEILAEALQLSRKKPLPSKD